MARELRRMSDPTDRSTPAAAETAAGVEVFEPGETTHDYRAGMPDVARFDAELFGPDQPVADTAAASEAHQVDSEAVADEDTTVTSAATPGDVAVAAEVSTMDNGYGDEEVSSATADEGGNSDRRSILANLARGVGRGAGRLTTLTSDRQAVEELEGTQADTVVATDPAVLVDADAEFAAVNMSSITPETGDDHAVESGGLQDVDATSPAVSVAIPTIPGLEIVQGRTALPRERHVGVDGNGLSALKGTTPDLKTRDETMEHPVVKPRVPGDPLIGEGARTSSEPATTAADSASLPVQRVVEDDSAPHSDTAPTLTWRQRRQLDRANRQEVATATAQEQLAQFLARDEARINNAIASGADRRHLAGGEPFAMLGTKTIGELHRIARCAILADQEVRTGVVWDAFTDPNLRDTELDQVRALVHKAYDRRSPNPAESVNMATELNLARREGVMQDVELAVDSATEAAERSVLPGIYVGLERHLVPAIEARRGRDSTKRVLSPAEALKKHAEEASLEIINGAHIKIRMEGDEGVEDDDKAEAYIVAGSREVVVRNGYFVDPTGQFRRDPEVTGIDKLVNYMGGYGAWFNNTPSGKNLQAEVLYQPPNTVGGFVAIQSFRSARFAMMSPTTDDLPSGRDPEAMGLAVPGAQGVDTTMNGFVEVTLDARHIYQGPYNQLLGLRNDELRGQPITQPPVLPHIAGEVLLEQARVVSERLDGIEADRQTAVTAAMEAYQLSLASSDHVKSLARQMGLVAQDEKPAIGRGSLKDVPDMEVTAGEVIEGIAHTVASPAFRPDATLAELASGPTSTLDMDTLLAAQDASDQRGQPISLT